MSERSAGLGSGKNCAWSKPTFPGKELIVLGKGPSEGPSGGPSKDPVKDWSLRK